jgi:hypothetical protein
MHASDLGYPESATVGISFLGIASALFESMHELT